MGVAKPAEAAMQMAIKKGIGSTPNFAAVSNAKGKANAAAALFVTNSVISSVTIYNKASAPHAPKEPDTVLIKWATDAAKPAHSMAEQKEKAQAIEIKMSKRRYGVYFWGEKSWGKATTTAVTEAKKNMSIVTRGKLS